VTGPHDVEIPDKVFFRIGEVARITGVKAYVLRYWETEFGTLRPQKSPSGQRRYRRSDIELVLRIKDLVWTRKFTIAGARSELRKRRTDLEVEATDADAASPVSLEPPVVVSVVDPELIRKVEELENELRRLGGRLKHSDKRAVEADMRAAAANARAIRTDRKSKDLLEIIDRQRKDLAKVRDSLVLLRTKVAAFTDES
jgi:DNA-binding transcriptional MerR regulator